MIKVLVCIPTFNNEGTILDVINDVKKYSSDILVINDGCTDYTSDLLLDVEGIDLITLPVNFGKGNALKRAFHYADKNGYDYILSIDADGQHFAESIPCLTSSIFHDKALVIGNRDMQADNMHVPFSSKFGKVFSNFWVFIETGKLLDDTQSGLRVYPVDLDVLDRVKTSSYDFEIELLVRMLWSGYEAVSVPVRVYYPPQEERVSHFDKVKDNLLLTKIHTLLILEKLYDYIKKGIK